MRLGVLMGGGEREKEEGTPDYVGGGHVGCVEKERKHCVRCLSIVVVTEAVVTSNL